MGKFKEDLGLALELAGHADVVTMHRFEASDLSVKEKPDLTPVSDADLNCEKHIRDSLKRSRPRDEVLGEEYGGEACYKGRQWVIDPIDGTKNFVRGVPVWATLIALLDDGAAVHDRDLVADTADHVHLVGDQHDGQLQLAVDLGQQLQHRGGGLWVEGTGGLVAEQDARLGGQRAGDADALLHAAGDFLRILVQRVAHVHQRQVVLDPVAPFALVHAALEQLVHRHFDVLVDGQPGQQRMVLEHHAAVRARPAHFLAVENHPAEAGLQQPGDDVQHRRLATAGVADDGDELALGDVQVDVLEHLRGEVAAHETLVQVFDGEIAHGVAPQLAGMPRVMRWPTKATRRSSTKPTTPM